MPRYATIFLKFIKIMYKSLTYTFRTHMVYFIIDALLLKQAKL